MTEINISDLYKDWVDDNLVPLFNTRGIDITANAINLFAWSMQMQVDEPGNQVWPTHTQLFSRANEFTNQGLIDFYINRYGEQPITFNRAFHLLAELGLLVKLSLDSNGTMIPRLIPNSAYLANLGGYLIDEGRSEFTSGAGESH